MIDSYLVRYFLAVVDQGNFSRAARQCGISQPTLSVGIAKLETVVGHVLFHRTNRRVELTAAGTTFAVHARRIEAELAAALQAMAQDSARKLVRVGVIPTLPAAWLEAAVTAACAVEGEKIELVEGRMGELMPRLERGRIDAVIGLLGTDPRGREPLFEEGYAMVMSSDHPLAAREVIDAGEVAGEDMLVRRNCEVLSDVSRFFTQRGVRPFFAARTHNDERALAYVRAGLGVTVMPRCFAHGPGGTGIAMATLAGFDQTRRIGVLTDPASARRVESSEALRRLCDSLRRASA